MNRQSAVLGRVFSLAVVLALSMRVAPAACAETKKMTAQDRLIAATCKTLLKGFIAVHAQEELIRKLQEMDEASFDRRYAKAFTVIGDSCLTRKPYSLTAGMPKEAVLAAVKQMKKEEMFSSVDCISDAKVAEQVESYLEVKKKEIKDSHLVAQVGALWQRILETTGMNK